MVQERKKLSVLQVHVYIDFVQCTFKQRILADGGYTGECTQPAVAASVGMGWVGELEESSSFSLAAVLLHAFGRCFLA